MSDRTHHHPRRIAHRLAGVVAVSVAPGAAPAPAAPAPDSGATVLAASHPTRLQIPAIDVDARGVIDLGLQPDRTMEVPPDGTTVGWFTGSPTPGELGPSVLAAHVDWNHEKGVFYDIHRLGPGDPITVDRADGSTATFEVQRVEQYPKDKFPTQAVYGDVQGAELRLITCGGELDRAARSYRDNIVVFATLVRST
jgi:hypothetical protein